MSDEAERAPTPEEIANQRAFLANITAGYVNRIMEMVEWRYKAAAIHEIDGLMSAVRSECEFAYRIAALLPPDPKVP